MASVAAHSVSARGTYSGQTGAPTAVSALADEPNRDARASTQPAAAPRYLSQAGHAALRRALIVLDIAALTGAFLTAYAICDGWLGFWSRSLLPLHEYFWLLWIAIPSWLLALGWQGLHDAAPSRRWRALAAPLARANVVAGLILLSALYLSRGGYVSRLFVQFFVALSFAGLYLERVGVALLFTRLALNPSVYQRRALVLGAETSAALVSQLSQRFPHLGLHVVGVLAPSISVETDTRSNELSPALSITPPLAALLERYAVDDVVAVCADVPSADIDRVGAECADRGIGFSVLVQVPGDPSCQRVEGLGEGWYLMSCETAPADPLRLLVKRTLDLAGAVVGLVICAGVGFWYRRRLRRESPGPLFFRQVRVGRNGRRFIMYKFRTMYPDAEQRQSELNGQNEMSGPLFKVREDPRVTPTGRLLRRTHLDELPQFWNVLRGDMSLVGTRPPTPDEVAAYAPRHRRRLRFRPGITGPWQVVGSEQVRDFEEVLRLDNWYIEQWSLWLDLKIIARTVVKVCRRTGW